MDKIIQHKNKVVENLKEYLKNSGIKNVVIGISGGIDSATSLAILCEALPRENIFPYFIGIESNQSDMDDAKAIASNLRINLECFNLDEVLDSMKKNFQQSNVHAIGNLKSRMRMMFLYDKAFNHNALVVGNSNLDELYVGYFTKYGDNGIDICLLNGFLKRDIFELAKYYKLPDFLQSKKPSAGLSEDQSDEKDLGILYSDIDKFLSGESVDLEIESKIINLHNKNRHKLFYNYDMNKSLDYKELLNASKKTK
ncbi:MAG: NAD(+) synthase [Mycoplasma sp.]